MLDISIPVYIMSGGKSRRFGSDKARALWRGIPLICHVAHRFAPIASCVTVVADQLDKYKDLGLFTIADITPSLGPLGGLHTALHHLVNYPDPSQQSDPSHHAGQQSPWFLFVSCDMLGLQLSWVGELWQHRTPDKPMVAFGPDPWDPLFSLVHPSVLPMVEQRIAQSQRAMWPLFEQVATPVPHPESWHNAVSINTQEALESYATLHDHPNLP